MTCDLLNLAVLQVLVLASMKEADRWSVFQSLTPENRAKVRGVSLLNRIAKKLEHTPAEILSVPLNPCTSS
jgi:hypothetical protein